MPLSFLSFLSFFFLFLFLLRDICLYSRSHRGPSKKETTVCVCCVCVCAEVLEGVQGRVFPRK